MPDLTLQALADRITTLEDRIAILELMASYGPAIDSGSVEAVTRVWTEDGIYDVDTGIMRGHAEISAMVRSQAHQSWIMGGCGHILEPGYVTIDGDTAVATCKSQLIINNPDAGGFTVLRVTANRWEMKKIDGQWKCTGRPRRVRDGRASARGMHAA
ncbi:nuclear transport factor 2 family protein, partial [Rhodococcus sp. NPDC058514]|uniref:nuclear transport factor 2 family protein n=1 Tax=Rhodococcus sp. NPDC058514 TaxID=3346532 RepID=UPI003662C2B1